MKRVKATREGLVGRTTANGLRIFGYEPGEEAVRLNNFFVALPSIVALGRIIRLRNPATGVELTVPVQDVGPFNIHDDEYVLRDARPAAESGQSVSGRGTNGAGIDLSEAVWHLLGMVDNTDVEWEFL